MKKLLKYFKGYRIYAVLAPFFKLLEAGFELLVPIIVAQIIDGITTSSDNSGGFIYGRVGILFVFALLGFGVCITAQYFAAKSSIGFASRVRGSLYEHMINLPAGEFYEYGQSEIVTRLTNDVNSLQNGVNLFLRLLLRSPFIVFGALIACILIDVKTSIPFIIVTCILCIVIGLNIIMTLPKYKNASGILEKYISGITSQLKGAKTQRAFGVDNAESEKTKELAIGYSRAQIVIGRISSLLNPLTWTLVNLGIILLINSGAIRVDSGNITQGQLVAMYNYMAQILVELLKFANLIISMSKAMAAADRISNALEYGSCTSEGVKVLEDDSLQINFDNVSMKYNNTSKNVLNNISFDIKQGEKIGVIGSTGSGKSSLAYLFVRLFDNNGGEITVNGGEISEYSLKSLHDKITLVPQTPCLFKGKVGDDIRMVNENITDEEISDVLKCACADDFADKDTNVFQNGNNLSGGQKQRLSLAVGLAKKSPFLILDDCLSALDNITENKIKENLRNLSNNPTIMFISQKVSVVKDCDRIMVLDNGNLVDIGNHDDLLKKCNIYRDICEAQR